MMENENSETAELIAPAETDECKQQGQWSNLPSVPLEKIYSLLYPRDQINMSLVCRKWSKGYGTPSVWKTFCFDMRESQILKDTCSVMKFARKYNTMFRHVGITCTECSNKRLVYNWSKHFIEFLQMLTSNTQLTSVTMRNLVKCYAYMDYSTCRDVYRTIANFLKSQHHLKRVEFYSCFVGFQDCSELLKILIENSGKSLEHLGICGSFRDLPVDQNQNSNLSDILPTLASFPRLKTLETDYSLFFENMVARYPSSIQTPKSNARLLTKIILHYADDSMKIEDFRGFDSADWRYLKSLYPNLEVKFNLRSDSPSRRELEFFILPNMPITQLNYYYCKINMYPNQPSLMDINVLLDHLLKCKINDELVSLNLKWGRPIPDIASTLIPFLQACKKLKCLELSILYPANGLILLLKSWLKTRPESLEKVHIYISRLQFREDSYGFMDFISEYESLLKMVGLNLKLDFIFGSHPILS